MVVLEEVKGEVVMVELGGFSRGQRTSGGREGNAGEGEDGKWLGGGGGYKLMIGRSMKVGRRGSRSWGGV